MAATIDQDCSECNGRHTFFLPDSDSFTGGAQYEYVCPETGNTTQFTSGDEWNETAHGRPRDAVVVNKV